MTAAIDDLRVAIAGLDFAAAGQARGRYADAVARASGQRHLVDLVGSLVIRSVALQVHRVDASPRIWLRVMENLVPPLRECDYAEASRITARDREVLVADAISSVPDGMRAPRRATTGAGKSSYDRVQSRTEYAISTLRDEILNGNLPAGTPLREDALAKRMGLSATPVREAIWQLSGEHLVTVAPAGPRHQVSSFTPSERADLIDYGGAIVAVGLRWLADLGDDRTLAAVASDLDAAAGAWDRGDTGEAVTHERSVLGRMIDGVGNADFTRVLLSAGNLQTLALHALDQEGRTTWTRRLRELGGALTSNDADLAYRIAIGPGVLADQEPPSGP